MINSKTIKKKAHEFGADLVGIGDISRFEGTPKEKDPRYIAPAAKSVIGLGFRVLRGCFRGIESGTQYYQLPTMGVANIDMRYAPMVLRRMACFLEDNGYEGAVQMAVNDRRPASDLGTNPEVKIWKFKSEPVAPGKPAPDVLMDFKQAAYLCGLGEMGMGGFFLTPEFGPLQRFAFILTDAELKPDPLYSDSICDNCGKCIAGCPGRAISASDKTVNIWNGRQIQYNRLDEWQCAAYYAGAHSPTNPFLPPDAFKELPDGDKIAAGEKHLTPDEAAAVRKIAGSNYSGVNDNYGACLCGKSCQRECYIHLEQKGVLRHKFINPFRPEAPWRIARKPASDELTLAE